MRHSFKVSCMMKLVVTTWNRPFCNFEKGTRERAAHSCNFLGNSRKYGASPPCCSAVFPPNLSCFRVVFRSICALKELHDSCLDLQAFSLDYLAICSSFSLLVNVF